MPTKKIPGLSHVTLENQWITRSWCITEGLATADYRIRPRGLGPWLEAMHWHPWWDLDGLVTVDGVDLPISRMVDPLELGMIRGVFAVKEVRQEKTDRVQRVDFVLTPAQGLPLVEATLHCELLNDEPMLRTWLTVRNNGKKNCEITRLALEAVYPMRQEMEFMRTGFDSECTTGNDQRFPCVGIPRTVHLQKTLTPGEAVESFSMLTAVCPADYRRHVAARHDLVHAFAPHTRRAKILQQADEWKDIEELKQSINEAAEVGVEVVLLFVAEGWSYGDLEFSKKLFPRGASDVKALCDYAAGRGVQIGFYVGECIATADCTLLKEHSDWQFLGIGGRRYDAGGVGNMCPSSGWGKHFREKIDELIKLGVKVLQTDGPPYGQVCHEKSHGHRSPETACLDNWAWEQEFNRDMLAKGVWVQTPAVPSRLFDGASQICGGYTEDDMSVLKGLDQITQFRSNLVAANDQLPPSCRWGFMSVGRMYGGARPAMVDDPEKEPVRLEHALATHLGLGFTACLHGKHLFNGPESKALLKKWIDFYNRYRPLLTCRTLTLRNPDIRGLDGVFHCSHMAKENPCGVAVIFNPSDHELKGTFILPLEFAGWTPGRQAVLMQHGEGKAIPLSLDDQGQGLLEVRLPAGKVEWWEIHW
jgi:hypothetical protein